MSGTPSESLGSQDLPVLAKACLTTMDRKLNLLNEKVDKLLHLQEHVTETLQFVCLSLDRLEQGLNRAEASQALSPVTAPRAPPANTQAGSPEVLELVRAVQQNAAQHGTRLEALFRMVVTVDKAIAFLGTMFQNSKVVDFITQGGVPWRRGSLAEDPEENKEKAEEKGAKPKPVLSSRSAHARSKEPWAESQKTEPPEGAVEWLPLIHASGLKADLLTQAGTSPGQGDGVPGQGQVASDHLLLPVEVEARAPKTVSKSLRPGLELPTGPVRASEVFTSQETAPGAEHGALTSRRGSQTAEEGLRLTSEPGFQPPAVMGPPAQGGAAGNSEQRAPRISLHAQEVDISRELLVTGRGDLKATPSTEMPPPARSGEQDPLGPRCCSQAPGTECGQKNLHGAKGSHGGAKAEEPGPAAESLMGPSFARRDRREDAAGAPDKGPGAGNPEPGKNCPAEGMGTAEAGRRTSLGTEAGSLVLDDSPPPPAPFEHRVVSVKETSISAGYTVCQHEVLGGGRFGQVHRCTEKSTDLPLAAKIIKVKSSKDREDVKNEINIMNQLSHVNLIQLYDAFESKNSFTLIMEYVDGGELFDRITDEKYHLTELDVVLFTRQICDGMHYLHQHYILHLDLKPENILCVSQTGHQIKIIDFGLARRYKPREKLKVNFGTPEFLAPEVVNYEFVSFPTDMWSVGVITYMLLSGFSPFLGETDAETMNFIVNCSWDFDADTFEGLSEEAKDFVSRLLVKEKSCRMSATQCLKHEWLNNLAAKASRSNIRLKSQLLLQKYTAQRKWKKHFYVVTAANRLRKFPTCP
ncbi:PREDICTED: myosin light chain kinase 3 [Elephantulus edwardii]|uniref:myosin light chain kinase 3 n=1 Tax=Elephantulus edwardii TaxID=28737 RepID=UPI0003F0BB55|nr:PREDICTED: myosin light chain kinase 3 [Elephantulus edwardii]